MLINDNPEENKQTPIQSIEPDATIPTLLLGGGKRKRSANNNDQDDDPIELPPPLKRQRVSEVIDLTDD
jgi:hypothetical protein